MCTWCSGSTVKYSYYFTYIYVYQFIFISYMYKICLQYIYIICIYCICVDRLMTRIAFQVANWFVFRMQPLWTRFFPSDCVDCMDLLEYVGNVWKCCLFASFKVTHPHLTQCRASLFKPQNRYKKYGFLNCLCQYAIFCS